MCECGCTMNETRYHLPGPDKTFYLVRLYPGCIACDAPAGVSIEKMRHDNPNHADLYKYSDGPLPMAAWADGVSGAAIVTGMLRHEFVAALTPHLTTLYIPHYLENGKIDDIGAEVILEEMYDDAQTSPHVV